MGILLAPVLFEERGNSMKLTLAGNDYIFASVELGGKTEDRTAFLLLKDSNGAQVAKFNQLESLEGFLFTEVL